MTYSEKLKDPRWQKKRLEILNRDKFSCCYCKDEKTELHVHHKKYKGNPWDAGDENLETVCKDCHGLIEYLKKIGLQAIPAAISKNKVYTTTVKYYLSFTLMSVFEECETAFVVYFFDTENNEYSWQKCIMESEANSIVELLNRNKNA